MEENPNVNRALSALLKELEHIKDLTSMADGYREVAHELSKSVEDYHNLNNTHIEQLCQMSEEAERASSERIALAQEQFNRTLDRIEQICKSLDTQEILNRMDMHDENVKIHLQRIVEEVKTVTRQQSKVIDSVEQCNSTLSKNLVDATQGISKGINVLKDDVSQVIRHSSDGNRKAILDHMSIINAKIANLDEKVSGLLEKVTADFTEQGKIILACLKENNDTINHELKALQYKISDINTTTHLLKKLGIAAVIGIAVVAGVMIYSICL